MVFHIFKIYFSDNLNKETQEFKPLKFDNNSVNYLVRYLQQMNLEVDDKGLSYGPIYVTQKQEIIFGVLAQTYKLELTKFMENTKKEVPINEDKANDKTYFFIDTRNSLIYIQNKKYYSDEKHLTPKRTMERIQCMLISILNQALNAEVLAIQPTKDYTIEKFISTLSKEKIKSFKARDLQGIKLPQKTKIHNGKSELDNDVIESWNRYSKDSIYSVKLDAAQGEFLDNNPLMQICFSLAKAGKDMHRDVYMEAVVQDMKKNKNIKIRCNNQILINIQKETLKSVYETYEVILKSLRD